VALQFVLAQPFTVVATVGYLVLSYAYSDTFFDVKSRGLLGTLLLCFCYGSFPVILGLTQNPVLMPGVTVALVALVALSMAPLLLAKDYKDFRGDKATNKRTPLVQFGPRRLRLIVGGLSLAAGTAYGGLAFEYGVNGALVLASVIAYLVLIRKIHVSEGVMQKSYRAILMLVLLMMPVSVIWCARP